MSITLSDIFSDPVTYAIVLGLFFLLIAFRKAWPVLTEKLESTPALFSRYEKIMNLLVRAARAAEQARRQGDLDGFVKMFGIKIDLKDNVAIRDAVVNWVSNTLICNFTWGKQIKVGEIMLLLEGLIREGAHKGAINPVDELKEQLRNARPEDLLNLIPVETIQAAADIYTQLVRSKSGSGLSVPPAGLKLPGRH